MSTGSRGWRTGVLLALCTIALSLVVVAAAGEWAVRHRERTRTSAPGTMSKIFYRHSRLMHALERGTDYYGWVSIGRQGFRGAREVSETPPDSVFRIIAVGGSTTFDGNTSGDSGAWPARLEQILDSISTTRRVEVLNAGVPGFQVFDDLIRLELELHRYRPDLIVLYQGHNDLFNTLSRAGRPSGEAFDSRPGEIPTVYPWSRWLERHSLLYHKLRSRWQAIRFRSTGEESGARATPADYARVLPGGVEAFARNVRLYVTVARTLGIDVVIPEVVRAATPAADGGTPEAVELLWRRAMPFATSSDVRKGYAMIDSATRHIAAELGALHVPASNPELWMVDGYADGDPIHFNDVGAWRFARNLALALRPRLDDRAHVVAQH